MSNTKEIKKFGVADCYGIESYLDAEKDEKAMGYVSLRGGANRQRHSVAYYATVPKKTDQLVQQLLRAKDWEGALSALKEGASSLSLMKGAGMKKSWGMIPNPDLDPYRG